MCGVRRGYSCLLLLEMRRISHTPPLSSKLMSLGTCTTGRFPNMTVSLMAFRQVLYQKLAEMIRVIYTRPKKGHCRDTSEQHAVEVAEQGRCHVLSHRVTACTNPHRPSDAQFDLRLPNRIALELRTSADFQVYTPQCKLCLIRSSMKMFNIEKVRLS